MFDIVEQSKNYSGMDGSLNIEAMRQNNIDRRVCSEE
jgi:hypothetical protein